MLGCWLHRAVATPPRTGYSSGWVYAPKGTLIMSMRIEDIVAEGTRVVALAEDQGVPLRLLGGVAVRLRCPEAAQRPELARTYKDIDVAAPRRTAKAVRELLTAQGYVPNSHFNALHGAVR